MDGSSIQKTMRKDFIYYDILSPIFESRPTINPLYTTDDLDRETTTSSIQSVASRRRGKNNNSRNNNENKKKKEGSDKEATEGVV